MQRVRQHFSTRLSDLEPFRNVVQEEVVSRFHLDGVAHLASAFSDDEIAAIAMALREVIGASSAPTEHLTDGFASWRAVTTVCSELAGLACDPRLVCMAMQLMGPRIRLLGSQFIRREPIRGKRQVRTPERHGWHRDIFGMSADLGEHAPRCAIKCAIWLSDAPTLKEGATRFLPGSHVTNMPMVPNGEIDPPGWLSFPVRKGDITVFSNRTAHAGGINEGESPLEVLMIQYGYRWLAPLPPRRHASAILACCSEVATQLLEPDDCSLEGRYRPGAGADLLSDWATRRT